MRAGAGLLLIPVLAMGMPPRARAQDFAQDFWWLRVVQALTAPLDVATPALLEQVLPAGEPLIQAPRPIADPATLALDDQLPAIPRAVHALAPYISAAHAVNAAELAVLTSPWFLQTAFAIKALRWHGAIQSRSDCEAVLQIVLDSALTRPDVTRDAPVFEVFAQALRAVSCAPGGRLYARAEALLRPPDSDRAGQPSGSRAAGIAPGGRLPYNAFPGGPLPVSRCRVGDSLPPAWVYSNGSAIALAGASTQVGRLLADASRHYPAILVVSGSPDSVYGVTFTGTLYRRTGAGVLASAGQCE